MGWNGDEEGIERRTREAPVSLLDLIDFLSLNLRILRSDIVLGHSLVIECAVVKIRVSMS